MIVDVTITDFFFDRQIVVDKMDAESRRGLQRMGGYVRRTARSSIKRKGAARKPPKNKDGAAYQRWLDEQKRKPRSRPGDPVFQHSDHPIVSPKNILFGWDGKDSVVIGMVGLRAGMGKPTPHEIEFGSQQTIRNARRKVRKIGDGGEVAIGGKGKLAANTRLGNVMVRYAALRTAAQVARANRINEELYGAERVKTTTAPRPVMAPAFRKGLDKFEPAFSGRLIG